MTIQCALCQKETPRLKGHQKYCPDCRKAGHALTKKAYAARNRDSVKAASSVRNRAWRLKNADARRQANKEYRAKNAARIKALRSSPASRERTNAARRDRYWSDPSVNMAARMSALIRQALKGRKQGSWRGLVDYTDADLLRHLERQFLPGMTWENRGQWHIDHIRPKRDFDQTDPDQFRECWALQNLRPLWAQDNKRKSGQRVHLL